MTYSQAITMQIFNNRCAVKLVERYDDCILVIRKNGRITKLPHDDLKWFNAAIVRKGNAPNV